MLRFFGEGTIENAASIFGCYGSWDWTNNCGGVSSDNWAIWRSGIGKRLGVAIVGRFSPFHIAWLVIRNIVYPFQRLASCQASLVVFVAAGGVGMGIAIWWNHGY